MMVTHAGEQATIGIDVGSPSSEALGLWISRVSYGVAKVVPVLEMIGP